MQTIGEDYSTPMEQFLKLISRTIRTAELFFSGKTDIFILISWHKLEKTFF